MHKRLYKMLLLVSVIAVAAGFTVSAAPNFAEYLLEYLVEEPGLLDKLPEALGLLPAGERVALCSDRKRRTLHPEDVPRSRPVSARASSVRTPEVVVMRARDAIRLNRFASVSSGSLSAQALLYS